MQLTPWYRLLMVKHNYTSSDKHETGLAHTQNFFAMLPPSQCVIRPSASTAWMLT